MRDAWQLLKARVQEALASQPLPDAGESTALLRIELETPRCNPFPWLAAQTAAAQFVWSGRDELRVTAGLGVADRVCGRPGEAPFQILERCRRYHAAYPELRYFGGFAFRPDMDLSGSPWANFGTARFWLPMLELMDNGADRPGRIACNLLRTDPRAVEEALRLMDAVVPVGPAAPLPALTGRRDVPDRAGWTQKVEESLASIAANRLQKIVLARKAEYRFAAAPGAASILARLQPMTSNCYHFLFQPDAQGAFMGSTPERLFRREGRSLSTEALAGTRPRSEDPVADCALSQDLLESAKDRHEHEIVRVSLMEQLRPLCEAVSIDRDPRLLLLERKQHLISDLQGDLKGGVGDSDLLNALHPTPAVGGYPREIAREEIARLEPFRRGWYAAPVGCVGKDYADFAVGIRSGLVSDTSVAVYSGAGIVQGSDPAEEWNEIENKIVDFVRVTGGA